MRVALHEAETNLAMLISAAERGEEVVISRDDKPSLKLVLGAPSLAPSPAKPKRTPGALAGYLSDEVIDFLTDPAVDKEIEKDFMDAVDKDWPA
jgi:antitoxin (DNA-binding transcriptional repressor) of toxin-antitoxin stability system